MAYSGFLLYRSLGTSARHHSTLNGASVFMDVRPTACPEGIRISTRVSTSNVRQRSEGAACASNLAFGNTKLIGAVPANRRKWRRFINVSSQPTMLVDPAVFYDTDGMHPRPSRGTRLHGHVPSNRSGTSIQAGTEYPLQARANPFPGRRVPLVPSRARSESFSGQSVGDEREIGTSSSGLC